MSGLSLKSLDERLRQVEADLEWERSPERRALLEKARNEVPQSRKQTAEAIAGLRRIAQRMRRMG